MCSVGAATFFCCREAQSLCLSALQGFFFGFFAALATRPWYPFSWYPSHILVNSNPHVSVTVVTVVAPLRSEPMNAAARKAILHGFEGRRRRRRRVQRRVWKEAGR